MLGIYDSGIGGLTVLKEILDLNSELDIIYIADNANLPLGEKTLDQIQNIVQNGVENLFVLGCDLVILACNTATVNTIRYLQQVWLPESKWGKTHKILGIGQPLLEVLESRAQDLSSKNGIIMATPATYKSGFYQSEVKQRGYQNLEVLPCLGLADAIDSQDSLTVSNKIEELFNQSKIEISNIDYVVLACTHYNWAKVEIGKYFLNKVEILDTSKDIVLKLQIYLEKHTQFKLGAGKLKFYQTRSKTKNNYNAILRQKSELNNEFELLKIA